MKLIKFFKSQKGFTLIELLVVIGVLGILATGLLATIDPLEQFRKGADSNRRTTALELQNALTRYYSVHNTFPWDTVANGGSGCNGGIAPAPAQVSKVNASSDFDAANPVGCLQQLVTEGELKSTFPKQYGVLNALWVVDTTVGSTKSVAICFDPDSKSESTKPSTNFLGNGAAGPTVPLSATCDPKVTSTCYTCTQ